MSYGNAPSAELPWLVADIGGTNARFGLITEPGGSPHGIKILRCGQYPDLVAATEAYLEHAADFARPSAACVAVAGPVGGDRFRLTNAHWDFSIAESTRSLGLAHLELVNDFSALALALPRLPADAFRPIGKAERVPDQPLAVIGPGTGLGVAGLVPARGGWLPIAGEGGHVTVPAETEGEAEVVRILRGEHPAVCAETVLSGPGLALLYRALCLRDGGKPEPLGPEQICERGRHGTDPICMATLAVFCGLLGAFAGNVALTLGARGGVLLGGGVLPGIADVLAASEFRRRFEAKPTMAGYLSGIATELIVAPTPALLGAAAWLAQQQEEVSVA